MNSLGLDCAHGAQSGAATRVGLTINTLRHRTGHRCLKRQRRHIVAALYAAILVCGCQTPERPCDHCEVSANLTSRFDAGLGPLRNPGETEIPAGVDLIDGLNEDESVQLAVWNNSALQETLAQLGVSSAQLLDAGLISDPQFTIFFPLGAKQLEFTAFQAVDALWLQPIRVRAAELDLNLLSQSMVQNGLDVIRDVRIAHAGFLLATDQAGLSEETARLRRQIADLAEKRLAAGDISELEVTSSQIDAQQAEALARRAVHDVTLARERLRVLIGLTMDDTVELKPEQPAGGRGILNPGALSPLLTEAQVMRPDLRAAEIAIEAAGERAGLARSQFMNLEAVYDANGSGRRGHYESGPGLRMTLPIFNRNRGGIAIANARWQQAVQRYITIRDQIALEVRTAHTQLVQANENLVAIQTEILPSLKTAEELARRNYEIGGTPYFLVLQTTGQYLDARIRELQLKADVRRATAELDRAVGHRVSRQFAETKSATEIPLAPAASVPRHPSRLRFETKLPANKVVHTGWRPTGSVRQTPGSGQEPRTPNQRHIDREVIHIPLELTRDSSGRISTVRTGDVNPFNGPTDASRKTKRKRRRQTAGRTRTMNSDQDAEHVEVTIDLRLDPRRVPARVRTGKIRIAEDGPSED